MTEQATTTTEQMSEQPVVADKPQTKEQTPVVEKQAQAPAETVEAKPAKVEETSVKEEQVANVEPTDEAVNADDEQGQTRTRSRRSPRHLRASGQRRRRPEGEAEVKSDDAPAFIPVADQAAAEYEAELKAKSEETPVDASQQVEQAIAAEDLAKVETVQNEQPAKVEAVANAKTVIAKGAASAPMAQPTPVADSEVKHTSVAMAHDKRELVPDSGLRAGSVKPAGRASSAMTKTMSAD